MDNPVKFNPCVLPRLRARVYLAVLLTGLMALFSADLMAQAPRVTPADLQHMDDELQKRLDTFYREWLKKASAEQRGNLQTVTAGLTVHEPEQALRLGLQLRANLEALHQAADDDLYRQALALLYAINDTATVRRITDFLNQQGSPAARSNNYMLLAGYYYARQNWAGVRAALQRVDSKLLPAEQQGYAALLHGYALQALKQHREAVSYYRHLPEDSPFFAYAKLNEGTAYLRQGWWSEAFLEFEQAIKSAPKDSELKDRVLVTLGFAQIHHEFYRLARATLRKVSLSSQHAPKAQLGLGLAATHQQDLRPALNLFLHLLESNKVDASVDEAYLLAAHVYEELQQMPLAAEAYRQAIAFYQRRLDETDRARARLQGTGQPLEPLLAELEAQSEEFYATAQPIPEYLLDNHRRLQAMQNLAREAQLKVTLGDLLQGTEQLLRSLALESIEVRQSLLHSYMSQAKYRLATLYDND